ncbi:MAG: DUF134 domain-containing protein [Candidatus Omnitrophica bacterium]|nr:DUF134 domain-containing protein [Candidatus Omnitrophota bacterium]
MSRPRCLRRIGPTPQCVYFKPAGIPRRLLETSTLTLDEIEAIKLADYEGLYQEEAAKRMNISRPTFTRLIESGRKKVAEALIKGKAIRMEGGPVELSFLPPGKGPGCGHGWRRGRGFGGGRGRGGQGFGGGRGWGRRRWGQP